MQDMNSGTTLHDDAESPPAYYAYTPPPTNALGIAGFVVSLSGMVACLGLICPIGLLLSLIALVKSPRGYAIAGSILGVLGSTLGALTVLLASGLIDTGNGAFANSNYYSPSQTSRNIDSASIEIDDHFKMNNGTLPDVSEGNLLITFHNDEWGNSLVYAPTQGSTTHYTIAAPGPDGVHGTGDDMTQSYNALNSVSSANPVEKIEREEIDQAFDSAARTIANAFPPGSSRPTAKQIELRTDTLYDAWLTPLKYTPADNPSNYNLDSAGPDRQWGTDDDITRTFPFVPNGETDGPL